METHRVPSPFSSTRPNKEPRCLRFLIQANLEKAAAKANMSVGGKEIESPVPNWLSSTMAVTLGERPWLHELRFPFWECSCKRLSKDSWCLAVPWALLGAELKQ